MRTPVRICFGSHDIKDLELDLPALPRKGDVLILPPGFVEYYNGAEAEDLAYKVRSVEFQVVSREQMRIEINVKPLKK